MEKKKFEISYHTIMHCSVIVEAETKEKAEELFNNGEFELNTWDNMYDVGENEIESIEECELVLENFHIGKDGKIIKVEKQ